MAEERYRPKEVRQKLGIASSTLRAWAKQFASSLSPGAANPPRLPDGRIGSRLYTAEDLATLQRAKELLAQGLTYRQVAEVLTRGMTTAAVGTAAIPPLAPLDELIDVLHTIADQSGRLDRLESRLDDLEKWLARSDGRGRIVLHKSRRTGRWSRYQVWREGGLLFQFYLGPATDKEIDAWLEQFIEG
ncbi:MAG: MerR family transcriptional regulator [Anaerolineae bacterium]